MMLLYDNQYCSVPPAGQAPTPSRTAFHGATEAASIQTYGILVPGKHPCEPKSRVMGAYLGHYGNTPLAVADYIKESGN